MSTTKRPMTKASVMSIMNSRVRVPLTSIGKRVKLLVQGDGNDTPVFDKSGEPVESILEPGTQLMKRIYNVRGNSELAMSNARNQGYLRNGLKAETLGGSVKGIIGNEDKATDHTASEWFSAYLNAVQISFGLLLPSATADKIGNGIEIACTIQKIDTENGSLLTIDPSTISVQAPETLSATAFDISMFEDAEEEEKAPAKRAPASVKKVLGK